MIIGFYQAAVLLSLLLLFIRMNTLHSIYILVASLVTVTLIAYIAFVNFYIVPVASLLGGIVIIFAGSMLLKYVYVERERHRVAAAFGRYVSPAIVDEIIDSGKHPELGGIKREITVLFSDIRNFTTITERLNPEEVVEMLNTYFEKVCNVVLAEGGTIDKFIGDAIMVQFGAPVAYPDHADRAIRAALKIQQVAEEFAQWMQMRFSDKNLPAFSIGVGINSGQAIIGNIGSPTHLGYTAIGDVTNSTARIESKTKELNCTILASKRTLELARSKIKTGLHETVSVKGKDIPLELYEIIGID
jgi:class 3 adenylate cyclase